MNAVNETAERAVCISQQLVDAFNDATESDKMALLGTTMVMVGKIVGAAIEANSQGTAVTFLIERLVDGLRKGNQHAGGGNAAWVIGHKEAEKIVH